MFYLPYFVSVVFFVLLPIATLLSAFYLISAYKGLPKTKETIDLTRFFHYGLAYITYILALVSIIVLTQSLAELYLGFKNIPDIEGFEAAGISAKELVRRDIAEAVSIFLISVSLHFYSYRRLKALRENEPDNAHDLLLHKLYFVGLLSYLVFIFVSSAQTILSTYLEFLTDISTFNLDELKSTSLSIWSKQALGVALSAILWVYNLRKLRRLGENI